MCGCREFSVIWALLLCITLLIPSCVHADTDPGDVSALNVLFGSLNNNANQLQGWTGNGGDPCGQKWKGISCAGSSVTSIKLSGLGLTGTIPGYNMNNLASLSELDMSNNNLGNNQSIPYILPPKLQTLNLANNQFGQGIPYSIWQMESLQYLNLAHNQLTGSIPDTDQLASLKTMDLSFNILTGDLPQGFSNYQSLTTLNLQNNQLTGHIDVLANLPLHTLNVENNRFTGWIPQRLKNINIQIGGNSWSSGPAPPPPPYTSPPQGRKSNPGSSGNDSSSGHGISGGAIAGIIITILVLGGVIAFFLVRRKSQKLSKEEILEQAEPFTPHSSDETKEVKPPQTSSMFNTAAFQPAAPISLKPPPFEFTKSVDEDDFANKPTVKKTNPSSIKATIYSVADLQIATDNFNMDNLVGEGSFGRVYKAQFSDRKVLAVKKINYSALQNQTADDFLELVSNISRLHHPNLNELVGYCFEYGQHLLVYEFHKNGSLQDLLHLSDEYSKPLSWGARVKIALGTARALEYLHEVCAPSVVHKNLKSSNILLDTELNPHLSDCGLESLVPNAEFQTAEWNTSAPEVAMSGQYTLKSDVYSFGVIMLELMTGRKPLDSSRPRSEQSLVRWATPQLHDIDALDRMVDPALKGLYPSKSVSRFADVIALCVQPEPEFRPPMSEVVQALVRLVQRANMTKRTVGGEGNEQDDFLH